MNAIDIILIILIAAALIFAVLHIIKSRKHGRSCCGDCCRCPKTTGNCGKKMIGRD